MKIRKDELMETIIKVVITALGLSVFIVLPIIAGNITNPPTETKETVETPMYKTELEQKYIVRFATATEIDSNGVTTYIDYDGNEWKAIDAPTKIGSDARLLFDSKETFDITDDVIIDITEVK